MASKYQNKTQFTGASVEKFLSKVKNEQRRKDARELIRIMSKITGKSPEMWGPSIISFDRSHYKYESGREGDMGAIGFSPRSTNLTLYLVEGTGKQKDLLKKLGPHKTGKVCVYIKRLSDVDMKVLEEMIETSYKYVMAHKTAIPRAE